MTEDDSKNPNDQITDFSIDHILNRAGTSNSSRQFNYSNADAFSWLQCSRYCPPKVPRTQRREGPQKRQLGRHPRIPFTSYQLSILEEKFQISPYLSSEEVINLSRRLQLADVRVKIWFQNRRARERRDKLMQNLEEEGTGTESSKEDGKNEEVSTVPVLKIETTPNMQTLLMGPISHYMFNQYPSNNGNG